MLNPSPQTKLSCQEVFGPVVCVYSYTDRDEAIARANGIAYGFQAAVFTKNLDVMLDTAHKLNATAVMIPQLFRVAAKACLANDLVF